MATSGAPARAADDPLKEASQAEAKGDWPMAVAALMRAKRSPRTTMRLAVALEKSGQLVDAIAELKALEADPQLGAAAKTKGAELRKRVPKLVIDTGDAESVVVTLDGAKLTEAQVSSAVPVDPGEHVVSARFDGAEPVQKKVTLAEGGRETVRLAPKPRPAAAAVVEKGSAADGAAPEGQGISRTTWGWIALGVGAGGVAAGAVFGLSAKQQRDQVRSACPNDHCPAEDGNLVNTGKTNAALSTISFVVGGTALLSGVVLFASAPGAGSEAKPKTEGASVRPYVGLGNAGLLGSF